MQLNRSISLAKVIMTTSGILTLTTILVLASLSHTTHADSVVDDVTITVPESCTFSEQMPESNRYTVEVAPGHYTENIGNTTFQVFCNDNNGYSVYAVGYSGNTIGNTDLISSNENVNNIATGITTSGTTSSWSMKMLPVTGTYAPTIENGYSAYKVVPSTYTKVATFPSLTDRTTGSSFQAKYAIYAGNGQAAGTFTGKVKYTLVHPNTADAPTEPHDTNPGYIGYYPNASGVVDNMGDQSIKNTATSARLWPINIKRPGYGFAGWSDAHDYKINEGSSSNPNAHIYGPMEDISFTAGQYSGTNKGLSLYAVWVKSAGNLQGWTGCNSLQQGAVTALTDTRDNNTYAVAKLADGKCWMIENLRLADKTSNNVAIELSSTNTHAPSLPLTNTWWTTSANDLDTPTTSNSLSSPVTPSSTTPWCNTTNANCVDQSMLATDNTTSTVANMTTQIDANIYSYGNYYNWYSATAGNGTYSTDQDNTSVAGDLCPVGWRLPKGGSSTNAANSDFYILNTEANAGATNTSLGLRTFPNNFLYSGSVNDRSSFNGRGGYGIYLSSTAYNSNNEYGLALLSSAVLPGTGKYSKYVGLTIRCLAGS